MFSTLGLSFEHEDNNLIMDKTDIGQILPRDKGCLKEASSQRRDEALDSSKPTKEISTAYHEGGAGRPRIVI